ncbi:hypothetical protein NPIL_213951 [Nephila pilipes]|uniref:Uncharacterized protein n=1 Tax=Nephila pilipes TaxID=299642 RepID=A0A8X6TVP0_NEPPI|nr:hypothetical protein NPIL_213951 [Nephila pilipes]
MKKKGKINIERWFPANTDAEDGAYRITSEILNTARKKRERKAKKGERSEEKSRAYLDHLSSSSVSFFSINSSVLFDALALVAFVHCKSQREGFIKRRKQKYNFKLHETFQCPSYFQERRTCSLYERSQNIVGEAPDDLMLMEKGAARFHVSISIRYK